MEVGVRLANERCRKLLATYFQQQLGHESENTGRDDDVDGAIESQPVVFIGPISSVVPMAPIP